MVQLEHQVDGVEDAGLLQEPGAGPGILLAIGSRGDGEVRRVGHLREAIRVDAGGHNALEAVGVGEDHIVTECCAESSCGDLAVVVAHSQPWPMVHRCNPAQLRGPRRDGGRWCILDGRGRLRRPACDVGDGHPPLLHVSVGDVVDALNHIIEGVVDTVAIDSGARGELLLGDGSGVSSPRHEMVSTPVGVTCVPMLLPVPLRQPIACT